MGQHAIECGNDGCIEHAKYRARFDTQHWSESPLFCFRFCEKHKVDYIEFKKLHGDDLGPIEIIGDREKQILIDFDERRKKEMRD